MKRFIVSCLLLLAGAAAAPAQSQPAAPQAAAQASAVALPPRISSNYNVIVDGITAGEALYTFSFRGADYQATARRQITRMAPNLLHDSQHFFYTSRGRIENGQVRPVAY